jgi:hypothetical protein
MRESRIDDWNCFAVWASRVDARACKPYLLEEGDWSGLLPCSGSRCGRVFAARDRNEKLVLNHLREPRRIVPGGVPLGEQVARDDPDALELLFAGEVLQHGSRAQSAVLRSQRAGDLTILRDDAIWEIVADVPSQRADFVLAQLESVGLSPAAS